MDPWIVFLIFVMGLVWGGLLAEWSLTKYPEYWRNWIELNRRK